MTHWGLYRLVLHVLPKTGKLNDSNFSETERKKIERILQAHRCVGAALCAFDETGVRNTLAFGVSHAPNTAVQQDTVFRAASVSKFVTALGAMKLQEQGRLDLDRDVNDFLAFSLRHPKASEMPITLRMLLSHTAGIHDGADYNTGIAKGVPLTVLLKGDSFTDHLPGTKWEYSNFGAGITGAVMEAATNTDFETLMVKSTGFLSTVNVTLSLADVNSYVSLRLATTVCVPAVKRNEAEPSTTSHAFPSMYITETGLVELIIMEGNRAFRRTGA